jgi:hypothetical protein
MLSIWERKILRKIYGANKEGNVRFQVLTVASMMFRIVFWDVLPCKMIVDNHFTQQYIPEDNSEHQKEGN